MAPKPIVPLADLRALREDCEDIAGDAHALTKTLERGDLRLVPPDTVQLVQIINNAIGALADVNRALVTRLALAEMEQSLRDELTRAEKDDQ